MSMRVPLIFDPTQFREHGLEFHEGRDFSCRYQYSSRFFKKNIYIPFGPICNTNDGLAAFLEFCSSFKATKIKIDLPLILNPQVRESVKSSLLSAGFKTSEYVQDDETILVQKMDFGINSKNRRYIKLAKKEYEIIIKKELSDAELDAIYGIYLLSAQRIGFEAKPLSVFKRYSEHTITSLAVNMNSKEIDGYVFGYEYEIDTHGFLDKDTGRLLQIFSTATNDIGRKNKIGYAMHYDLFEAAFNDGIDIIDFHGASRKNGRSYVEFKTVFGGDFFPHAGSFERFTIF